MKHIRWQLILGVSLVTASIALFTVQIVLFHDERNTFFYLLQDLAFIPIQVLIVTLILDQLLIMREKLALLNKLNMVIGTFFSEAGTPLLKSLATFDGSLETVRASLLVTADWTDGMFTEASARIREFDFQIGHRNGDLTGLRALLLSKRDFLLGLLENPNLLEHETFTDLLWAVFHLTEELSVRDDLASMPLTDGNHLAGDIKRAYAVLIVEWLAYLKHLKHDYPYLYSFALRTNPFDPKASPIVG